MVYVNINLFHFRIKEIIARKCLFCDFLQKVHSRSHMLHAQERISSTPSDDLILDVSLFVCKHFLVSHATNTKIRYGSLNFGVAKFKGLRYSHQTSKYFAFPSKHWHDIIYAQNKSHLNLAECKE